MLGALLLSLACASPDELTIAFVPDDDTLPFFVVAARSDNASRALSWLVLPHQGSALSGGVGENAAAPARALPFPALPAGTTLVDDGQRLTLSLPPVSGAALFFSAAVPAPAKAAKRSEPIPMDGTAALRLALLGTSDHRAILSDGRASVFGTALWWTSAPTSRALLLVRDKSTLRTLEFVSLVPVAGVESPLPLAVDVASGQFTIGSTAAVADVVDAGRVAVGNVSAPVLAHAPDVLILRWHDPARSGARP